ncbi:hypothetical protein H6S82_15360 [Planktothrix sp. FACHB-1355]|uniref:Methyltransferase type 11 domain-containing protein n=1 Tax=Aerosakkonema funiforme FACHB-1375 TaxID=2949571 RepID=A0A926ZEK0_9CYAN|nr:MULTISPECIES: hypothetical protein [Oscillatoriales]MBD2179739.1 hypothetical protein [Aerosakkonema funiforme FACHB-1375]MBD3560219.1 hypothetical protein [Planktothrix sp. FACHB-1355]
MLNKKIQAILVCPETKKSVHLASQPLIDELNFRIEREEIKTRGGHKVENKIDGGLLYEDGTWLYPIENGTPIMVINEAIPTNHPPIATADTINVDNTAELLLNAGCGQRPLPGFINVDFEKSSKADVICDLRYLPFKNGVMSKILCNHVLEHLNEDMWRGKAEISEAVLEFSRVLNKNGNVEIEVPSPQGQDAVRGDHFTVYGHLRLIAIFRLYFESVKCAGVGTWVEARGLIRLFNKLSKWDPYWGNAYKFFLSNPKSMTQIVMY